MISLQTVIEKIIYDSIKLFLFELVGDRSVTVPKPFSNQLHQLQEESPWGNRQVADHLQVKTKMKTPLRTFMHFYRWELGESLQRMCDWGFNELLTPFLCSTIQRNAYCASFFMTISDMVLPIFMHFNITLMKKNVPILNIYKRINISPYRGLAILRHTFI